MQLLKVKAMQRSDREETMIYMDHAATTPVHPAVLDKMLPCLQGSFGNPSSIYGLGRSARNALMQARRQTASLIGASHREIYFTSGGTEADNWAIIGAAESRAEKGKNLITSKIEHPAVLRTMAYLEKRGYDVTYLTPDSAGRIRPEDVEAAIRPDTILVSIMMANNEIGTIEPIAQIGRITREKGILLHTDAVQACGQIPVDVKALQVDLLSGSSHKMYGPKGAGFLYSQSSVLLPSWVHGGGQERGKRGGTENVAGIVGLGEAAQLAKETLEDKMKTLREKRAYFARQLCGRLDGVRLIGVQIQEDGAKRDDRLPGHLSFAFAGVSAETLLVMLDAAGICASAGSACSSGSLEPSHVLTAIGEAEAAGSVLRFTLGSENTVQEIDRVVEVLVQSVERLRE